MTRLGAGFLLFGACMLLLPFVGLQLRGQHVFGKAQIPIAVVSLIIGLVLVVAGKGDWDE